MSTPADFIVARILEGLTHREWDETVPPAITTLQAPIGEWLGELELQVYHFDDALGDDQDAEVILRIPDAGSNTPSESAVAVTLRVRDLAPFLSALHLLIARAQRLGVIPQPMSGAPDARDS